MKGKKHYFFHRIEKLKYLISKRMSSGKEEQKQIRAQMRGIGFYGSGGGMTNLELKIFHT
jgi:hypothetical protein